MCWRTGHTISHTTRSHVHCGLHTVRGHRGRTQKESCNAERKSKNEKFLLPRPDSLCLQASVRVGSLPLVTIAAPLPKCCCFEPFEPGPLFRGAPSRPSSRNPWGPQQRADSSRSQRHDWASRSSFLPSRRRASCRGRLVRSNPPFARYDGALRATNEASNFWIRSSCALTLHTPTPTTHPRPRVGGV